MGEDKRWSRGVVVVVGVGVVLVPVVVLENGYGMVVVGRAW